MRDFRDFRRPGKRDFISPVQIYQDHLVAELTRLFIAVEVIKEWPSMQDENNLSIYSPRIDVAIGPFATHDRLSSIYDEITNRPLINYFLRELVRYNRINLERYGNFVLPADFKDIQYLNYNARCFMAIEIEHIVSQKHLMGGAINASALGRFGIVMPWSDRKLREFVRLVRYLHYLKYAEKNTFNTTNLLIITKEQMDEAITNTINEYF